MFRHNICKYVADEQPCQTKIINYCQMKWKSKRSEKLESHDDVIKWKHFPRYWPFVRGIHRSPVNSPHKGQWRGALIFTLICARIKGWVNNREAVDLRRYRGHYDVTVMVGIAWKTPPFRRFWTRKTPLFQLKTPILRSKKTPLF